jgi:CHAT domain-containing protein
VFIPLCEESKLLPFFNNKVGGDIIQSVYRSTVVEGKNNKNVELGDSLYSIIWKPLAPYLDNIEIINYSPAGLLYKVAFHALPAGNKKLLIDDYQLNQYINLRQLAIDRNNTTAPLKSIALFGNSNFDEESSFKASISLMDTLDVPYLNSRGNYNKAWNSLPGTLTEIENIQSLLAGSKVNTLLYTGGSASEENFKHLSNDAPSVIHLATHGFFLPDINSPGANNRYPTGKNAFENAVNPLMRSGIILSGANNIWEGKLPVAGKEDGVVTAYEISQLNLSKTELVILSACETALGDIKGNEGVFGLQRAFKLAGVKNMILSLWKVPDKETAELMTLFYKNYFTGKTIKDAFNTAQKEMRIKYSPYSWAAFVLIE